MANDIIVKDAEALSDYLKEYNKYITRALPESIQFGMVLNCALNGIQQVPALLNVTRDSFFKCLIESVCIGLVPFTPLNHSWIIPFKNEAKLIPGYQGYISLAYNTGIVDSINAYNVFEDEEFDYLAGTKEEVIHHPRYDVPLSEREYKLTYCITRLRNSTSQIITVMNKEEIMAIKARSKSSKSSYSGWVTDPYEMYKKTLVRKNSKMVPKTFSKDYLNFASAVMVENQFEGNEDQQLNKADEVMQNAKEEWDLEQNDDEANN